MTGRCQTNSCCSLLLAPTHRALRTRVGLRRAISTLSLGRGRDRTCITSQQKYNLLHHPSQQIQQQRHKEPAVDHNGGQSLPPPGQLQPPPAVGLAAQVHPPADTHKSKQALPERHPHDGLAHDGLHVDHPCKIPAKKMVCKTGGRAHLPWHDLRRSEVEDQSHPCFFASARAAERPRKNERADTALAPRSAQAVRLRKGSPDSGTGCAGRDLSCDVQDDR